MKLVVVGMGYVGIPSAALFADIEGINVVGVQRRSERSGWKIDYLNQGRCPIQGYEPGLPELIEKVVKKGTFQATDDTEVYREADIILVDVQTPVDIDHVPQYESLTQVSKEIGKKMKAGVMVGIESTVAPGTTENIVKPILEEASGMKAGEGFNLMFSYERVMVGRLLHNLQYMPRVVGGCTAECARRGAELYRKIVKAEVYETDCLTAEIAKVAENAYRDVNIAFANEVALICESLGADVHEVRSFVNSLPYDPRDPAKNPFRMMMTPGAGVGGHCLPKDSWLLKYGADKYGSFKVTPRVLEESRRVNEYMPNHMRDLIIGALKQRGVKIKKARVALLGYAFLEDSDDTRNTPTLPLYRALETLVDEVIIHDPYVKEEEDVKLTQDLEKAVKGVDCAALVTRHRVYGAIDLNWLRETMRTPIIVDGRNVFKPEEASRAGFTFRGVGIGLKLLVERA